mgnify:CR=1 FL=1
MSVVDVSQSKVDLMTSQSRIHNTNFFGVKLKTHSYSVLFFVLPVFTRSVHFG